MKGQNYRLPVDQDISSVDENEGNWNFNADYLRVSNLINYARDLSTRWAC